MENLVNIINIYNRVGTYTSLDDKMQTLKRKCETLRCREADIIAQLQFESSSSRKKQRNEVEDWLVNVKRTRNGVQSIESEVSTSGLLGRIQLMNRVEYLTKEVAELMEQGQFCEGLMLDAHIETKEEAFLIPELVGRAFQSNFEIIWEHLKKAEVLVIGVWGMGGVGKTTLATHIYNRLQVDRSTFDRVYWVTVSQNSSVRLLQDDIAKAIHFDISFEEDERKRASSLSEAIMRKKERLLIVLDDVWNDIDLEKVGVVVGVNGCKIIVTTRSLEVCRMLDCDEKIKLQPLSEGEAWDLFLKNLNHHRVALSPQVLEVAKCVARECAGLPLGIVTVARCMRGVDDICEWRDAFRALKESKVGLIKMEEEVFQVLKFSYSRLNDPKVQQCFLYCALYPEDYQIDREELIQCLIDEGIIEKMRRQTEFDKGHAMLNKLVNSCLLEAIKSDGEVTKSVKMHDLLRDMAIRMSPQCMVKAGMQLGEIDEQDFPEYVEKVSFMRNNIEKIASGKSPRCPKLSTLLLSGNRPLKRIGDSFFKHMHALQVLNLSYCECIKELPNSVSNMKNLSALVLRGCRNLQVVPSLAELNSLKRLDIWGTSIREVPHGLERLVYLVYLDLSNTQLEAFPTGILPKLFRLESLKFNWSDSVIVKIKGEELGKLQRLQTFVGHLIFDDVNGFKSYLMSGLRYRGPNCIYCFALGDGRKYRIGASTKKKAQEEVGANVDIETLEALLKDVKSLEIDSCCDARNLCDVPTCTLKRCRISHCERIQCLGSFSSPYFLQTLEILEFHKLGNLGGLFELEERDAEVEEVEGEIVILSPPILPPPAIFSCLKQFRISFCPKIKKLFQPRILTNLRNLQDIYVWGCSVLEEIIASEPEDPCSNINHFSTVHYTLPNLKTLKLIELPELKSICAETISCGSFSELFILKCPKLKRIPLSRSPSSLQSIKVYPPEWWKSMEWDMVLENAGSSINDCCIGG